MCNIIIIIIFIFFILKSALFYCSGIFQYSWSDLTRNLFLPVFISEDIRGNFFPSNYSWLKTGVAEPIDRDRIKSLDLDPTSKKIRIWIRRRPKNSLSLIIHKKVERVRIARHIFSHPHKSLIRPKYPDPQLQL